jgi:lipoprotein-anchoring transpeptidase ErfK/SrfK
VALIRDVRALVAMVALTLAPAMPASADTRATTNQPAIPQLKPGQSIWFETPEMIKAATDANAAVRVVIAIRQQQALVYRGDRLAGVTTVSTGSPGYETPLGEFTILEKKVFHRSNLYSNAPMPYMQRLTWGGVALHAGALPGYPASHGCIRLPTAFARQLFDLTAMGGTVLVVDDIADAPLYLPLEPVLMADTRSLRTSVTSYTPPVPLLAAETHNLGGGAYEVLTMGGDPPAGQSRQLPASRGSR